MSLVAETRDAAGKPPRAARPKRCFICHSPLLGHEESFPPHNQETVEHFIPQWLLRAAGLHVPKKGNRLVLTNNVSVPGPVTVPCCKRCNGALGRLETQVRRIFQNPGPPVGADWTTMFLWLLKVAYGASYIEAHRNMSNRNDVQLGKVMSRSGFQRLQLFHRRILREYCLHGSIAHLRLFDYSLLRAQIDDPALYFSKSTVRNRVTLAWQGQVFRLTIDRGREEELVRKDPTFLKAEHFGAFMSSNDLFTPERVQYPRLKNGRQRMSNATPRKVAKGDFILVTHADQVAEDRFLFSGHVLEQGGIVAEENSVQIVVRRTQETERMQLDEFELQQPGLMLVTKSAAGTLNFSEELGMEDPGPPSEEQNLRQLLLMLHFSFGVYFRINPPVPITPEFIPEDPQSERQGTGAAPGIEDHGS